MVEPVASNSPASGNACRSGSNFRALAAWRQAGAVDGAAAAWRQADVRDQITDASWPVASETRINLNLLGANKSASQSTG